jgi:hypothetical protein
MSQVQISTETALRETMIENEWRKGRMMILAQQLIDAQREKLELRQQVIGLKDELRCTDERSELGETTDA